MTRHTPIATCLQQIALRGIPSELLSPSSGVYTSIPSNLPLEDIVSVWMSACGAESCPVLAAIYVDVATKRTMKTLTPKNVNSYLVAGLLVATKWADDVSHYAKCQKFFASLIGVPLEVLNRLELQFLADVDWNLFVALPKYHAYQEGFKKLSMKQGRNKAVQRSKSS
eukprot:TRINITY_DN14777_c0_g2_i1.p1 TRINITY_DN14777_c0_g2~~TRINITY_DN14777_c0_g2_i1.p1  ORF type:complete len:183 (+),score=44.12 TRINITY_DN14777_c0_g2_i1:47-550(+)